VLLVLLDTFSLITQLSLDDWANVVSKGGLYVLTIQSTKSRALSIMSWWHCSKPFDTFIAWKRTILMYNLLLYGTGGNRKRLRNGNWRCYQAESTRRQALKRSVRFSLAQASLRQTPKKSEISQRLCVCENRSAIVLSVTDSLSVFDSTHTF